MDIRLNHVTKVIRDVIILDNISLHLASGHIYGLQGPNGHGKTMLLRLIAGLIKPTEGMILYNGKPLPKGQDFPKSLGVMIETPAFWENYTGKKNLELLAEIRGSVTEKEIDEMLIKVGLDPKDKRTVRRYSLGMKQRLGIAAALMESPELILLDEPTNALDENGIADICQLIKEEKTRGSLIVVASHDADVLKDLADITYIMKEGRILDEVEK
ncbi:MAG: ABC transporter ATP-binding protein [Firmicutes bacterium]|nr:ABC transporter ATP-binding protein [Bacillota bacterium]